MDGELAESDIPVALFLYRRPDLTRQVFAAIRRARPRRLVLVADGPGRDGSDRAAVEAARAAVDEVDWPCEVVRDYAAARLGAGRRVASGLDALFAAHDEAIVLEDDCVPEPGFFRFCAELLAHHRDDPRVMMVCGTNPLEEWETGGRSHLFSRLGMGWGWASWRRAWRHYDFAPPVPDAATRAVLVDRLGAETADHHLAMLAGARTGRLDAWDVQWTHACLLDDGLAAVPAHNMVTNVGFGSDATHTKRRTLFDATRRARPPSFPLHPPEAVAADAAFDRRVGEVRRGAPSVELLSEWIGRLLDRGSAAQALAALIAGQRLHGEAPALAALDRRARAMLGR